ncbi:hypothetical protein [Dyadobacter sp. 32]|uniref:hypothetical protein n=1 Tax=Dyadobacter sp. 32 TaxID=538966 RepID=UPI0011ECE936
MNPKNWIVVIDTLILGILGWYLMLRPTYKLTHYQLKFCGEVHLTQIEYSNIKERGVAFVYGKHTEESIPQNCIIDKNMSGFDSVLEAVFTCNNKGDIFLNYNTGYYIIQGKVDKIIENRVKATEFDELKSNSNNLYIILE